MRHLRAAIGSYTGRDESNSTVSAGGVRMIGGLWSIGATVEDKQPSLPLEVGPWNQATG